VEINNIMVYFTGLALDKLKMKCEAFMLKASEPKS
jgi:hypothetical protein